MPQSSAVRTHWSGTIPCRLLATFCSGEGLHWETLRARLWRRSVNEVLVALPTSASATAREEAIEASRCIRGARSLDYHESVVLHGEDGEGTIRFRPCSRPRPRAGAIRVQARRFVPAGSITPQSPERPSRAGDIRPILRRSCDRCCLGPRSCRISGPDLSRRTRIPGRNCRRKWTSWKPDTNHWLMERRAPDRLAGQVTAKLSADFRVRTDRSWHAAGQNVSRTLLDAEADRIDPESPLLLRRRLPAAPSSPSDPSA